MKAPIVPAHCNCVGSGVHQRGYRDDGTSVGPNRGAVASDLINTPKGLDRRLGPPIAPTHHTRMRSDLHQHGYRIDRVSFGPNRISEASDLMNTPEHLVRSLLQVLAPSLRPHSGALPDGRHPRRLGKSDAYCVGFADRVVVEHQRCSGSRENRLRSTDLPSPEHRRSPEAMPASNQESSYE
jgi:hypothetical protein